MLFANSQSLVSVDWLTHHIDAVEIRILCASLQTSESDVPSEKKWRAQHIPYSSYFDINGLISDQNGEFVDPASFADHVMASGVGNGNKVIVYDMTDGSGAILMWWLLRYHGHNNVAVLDGGMSKWSASGKEISDRPRRPKRHNFTSILQNTMFVDNERLEEVIDEGVTQVFDTDIKDVGNELLTKSIIQSSKPQKYPDERVTPEELYELCSSLRIKLDSGIIITGNEMIAKTKLAFLLHLLGADNLSIHCP